MQQYAVFFALDARIEEVKKSDSDKKQNYSQRSWVYLSNDYFENVKYATSLMI